ncbi:glycosyl hydrolase [Hufsiella ginkgonis]|uniref:Glycoside hydrolase n=1 Tax=Hufsiella ginkgonis TaxID=2695274 RepID=A0A7K1Y3E3_9SPHI|nr:glycosyl hydrolase [Hufsiella ginkgonis]MXV17813.1 glycoside hydrolase [Hufsiella ginkgonis]
MKKLLFVAATALLAANVFAQSPKPVWPAVKKEMKPWTRWWWMGSAVDEKNIASLLKTYREAGFGGVEIAPIYGAKGFEKRYVTYLSPEWMSLLKYTVQQAGTLEMGVDLTNGTGWPFGGPQVKTEQAATKLFVQQYDIPAGKSVKEVLDSGPKLPDGQMQALTVANDHGEVLDLWGKDDLQKMKWTPEKGSWKLYAAISGKTRQMVKRAAPGGEGFTLDHLSSASVTTYLDRFDKAFNGKSPGVRSFFNDSYEVYDATWSPAFFSEFEQRRGYDLRLHLPELVSKEKTDRVSRVKSDYRETMAEMLLANFTVNWTNWAHRNGGLSKNQSHGSPGNLLDLYGAVDIPECETFGSSYFPIPGLRRDSADIRNVDPDPMMLKFASSAAHTHGKPLVSSETFTWLTEHFKTSLSQAKPELDQVFLSGVNHVFFHGATYSPEDVPYPGWLFYASVNFVPSNSFWPHLKGLNEYIMRCQSVLQAGRSDNELLIYWPVYDAWSNPAGMDMPLKVHDVDVWLHPTQFYKTAVSLQQSGYSFDFASDKVLAGATSGGSTVVTSPQANPYQTLIVPQCKLMPVGTFKHIIRLAREGATVIFQELPEDVPGLSSLEAARKELSSLKASLEFSAWNGLKRCLVGKGAILVSADVKKALLSKDIRGEAMTEKGLNFIRRKAGNDTWYFVANLSAKSVTGSVSFNRVGRQVLIMDPMDGSYGAVDPQKTETTSTVDLRLQPGETRIIRIGAPAPGFSKWQYPEAATKSMLITNSWKLSFTQGGPELPADQVVKNLVSWTELNDPRTINYSGSAVYTTTFNLAARPPGPSLLDLGKVAESAHVWINGKDAGFAWSIPFRLRVEKFLKPGLNTLRIEVANLMANRMRYMDQQGISWRNYNEINFVNIDYKPFDASKWKPMASGLLGPVRLVY